MKAVEGRGLDGAGYFILRHRAYNKGANAYTLDMRHTLTGVEVSGRSEFGHYIADSAAIGDIIGGHLWTANPGENSDKTRPIPAWAFAWPAVTVKAGGTTGAHTESAHPNDSQGGITFSPGSTTPNPGAPAAPQPKKKSSGSGPTTVLPLIGDPEREDRRFKPISVFIPPRPGEKKPPKFPVGTRGVVLAATNEDKQVSLFFPSLENRITAIHELGDVAGATLVCDVLSTDEIDFQKTARLHSLAWVVRKTTGAGIDSHGENWIAWNIGDSGQLDVIGGGVIDGGTVGMVSQVHSGPFVVGAGGDKHALGISEKAKEEAEHNVNSLHLSTNAYFVGAGDVSGQSGQDAEENESPDGPLDFEGNFPEDTVVTPFPMSSPVHLEWWTHDNTVAGREAEAAKEGSSKIMHPHKVGQRVGKWKWRAEVPYDDDEDEGGDEPESGGGDPEGGGDSGSDDPGPPDETPVDDTGDVEGPEVPPDDSQDPSGPKHVDTAPISGEGDVTPDPATTPEPGGSTQPEPSAGEASGGGSSSGGGTSADGGWIQPPGDTHAPSSETTESYITPRSTGTRTTVYDWSGRIVSVTDVQYFDTGETVTNVTNYDADGNVTSTGSSTEPRA